jgi:hypothetical protein
MAEGAMLRPNGDTPLREARAWIKERRWEGQECPCCTQLAKVYHRNLNSSMARDLIWLVRESPKHPPDGWVPVSTIGGYRLQKSREMAKLQHWNLIEPKPSNEKPESGARTNGIWRPTKSGIAFAHANIRVPKYVDIYDDRCLQMSDETTSIVEAHEHTFWCQPIESKSVATL